MKKHTKHRTRQESTMSRGHDYENEVAKNIYYGTDSNLYPIRAGYSGNGGGT